MKLTRFLTARLAPAVLPPAAAFADASWTTPATGPGAGGPPRAARLHEERAGVARRRRFRRPHARHGPWRGRRAGQDNHTIYSRHRAASGHWAAVHFLGSGVQSALQAV